MAGKISFPKSQRQQQEREESLAKQTMTSRCLHCGREKSGTFRACRSWFRMHQKTCVARRRALAQSS